MSQNLTGNERFNTEAASWDSNPAVHEASSLALKSILHHLPDLKSPNDFDVLEIGCGTGLLSFNIAPYIRSLTAVDPAQGMIDAFNAKLASQPDVRNILPVCAELSDPYDGRIRLDPLNKDLVQNLPTRKFDLIISHLVLHHIPSLEESFKVMYGCLKKGGKVALTDFEDFGPEAKRFHPESKMEGVMRHGIHRLRVRGLLETAGFVDVRVQTAFEMEKWVEASPGAGVIQGEAGTKMKFPFLICIGRKDRDE
jgi:SAM-dependent methyltransferase